MFINVDFIDGSNTIIEHYDEYCITDNNTLYIFEGYNKLFIPMCNVLMFGEYNANCGDEILAFK